MLNKELIASILINLVLAILSSDSVSYCPFLFQSYVISLGQALIIITCIDHGKTSQLVFSVSLSNLSCALLMKDLLKTSLSLYYGSYHKTQNCFPGKHPNSSVWPSRRNTIWTPRSVTPLEALPHAQWYSFSFQQMYSEGVMDQRFFVFVLYWDSFIKV